MTTFQFACEIFFWKGEDYYNKKYEIDEYHFIYSDFHLIDSIEPDYDILDLLFQEDYNDGAQFRLMTQEDGYYHLFMCGTFEFDMSYNWEYGGNECDGVIISPRTIWVEKAEHYNELGGRDSWEVK
jgi:hypothetical protein